MSVRRHALTALVVAFALSWCPGQKAIFAYGYSSAPADVGPPTVTGYKVDVVQHVLDDLVRARGDHRKAKPELVLNKGRRYVAWMDPTGVVIGLEEKAYDLCRTYGPDSLNVLANLLAHELTHYYENHDWSRHFVSHNQGLTTSEAIDGLAEGIKLETQADYLGGMLAISAGYDGYAYMPDFLRKTYAAYGFADQLEGYPSLEERVRVSENAATELKGLHAVYQTANDLTFIDAYEVALAYYEYVLASFQSYEVYNNAGVCATLAALDLTDPKQMPFALPLELDPTSRLDALATRLPDDPEARRKALLRKARQYFRSATELTRTEAVGYLNLAVVHLLEGDTDEADFLAARAQKIARREAQPKTRGDALILRGILAARDDDPTAAREYLGEAASYSPTLAALNLAVLEGKPAPPGQAARATPGPQKIGPRFLDDFLYDPDLDLEVGLNENVFCGKKTYPHSTILLHFADEGDQYAIFQRAAPGYAGTSKRGARAGDHRSRVEDLYSTPDKIIQLRTGSCLRYDAEKILFYFDARDRLTHWTIFAQQSTLP